MYLTRHSDMIKDVNLDELIVVAGAGSIGSYAVLALSKLGFNNIMVFDDGIVEEENIAPQFYRPRDIGKLKVKCLKEAIKQQTGAEIIVCEHRLSLSTLGTIPKNHAPILIYAVDTMEARKHIFNNLPHDYGIDARMAIEFLTIFEYSADERETSNKYHATLFSDSEAVQEACTNKAIAYTSLIAGALVAKAVLTYSMGDRDSVFKVLNYDIKAGDMVII